MDEASQKPALPDSIDAPLPTLSVGFAVPAHRTITWKIASDSTLRVVHERVWLTRARSPDDYWLHPGDTIRLVRGERVWMSSDSQGEARVLLTSAWSRRHTVGFAWIEWFAGWCSLLALRRARQ